MITVLFSIDHNERENFIPMSEVGLIADLRKYLSIWKSDLDVGRIHDSFVDINFKNEKLVLEFETTNLNAMMNFLSQFDNVEIYHSSLGYTWEVHATMFVEE